MYEAGQQVCLKQKHTERETERERGSLKRLVEGLSLSLSLCCLSVCSIFNQFLFEAVDTAFAPLAVWVGGWLGWVWLGRSFGCIGSNRQMANVSERATRNNK